MVVFTKSHKILSMNLTIKFKQFLRKTPEILVKLFIKIFTTISSEVWGDMLAKLKIKL